MGKDKKTEQQMKNGSIVLLMLLVLHMEIKPLLEEAQLSISRGIVLVAENKHFAEQLLRSLIVMGAKIYDCQKNVINSDTCIMTPTKKNSKKVIMCLEGEEIAPILICYGIPPEYLSGEYIIPVDSVGESVDEEFLKAEIERFRKYVRASPELVVRELQIFKSSTWYLNNSSGSILNISLHAVLSIYKMFYREYHDEGKTENIMESIKSVIELYVYKSEEYGACIDIVQPLRSLMITYMDNHEEVGIGDVDEVNGALTKALEANRGILYDEDWYYIPEKLFYSICDPILQFVSMPEIKKNLVEEGFLYCNNNLGNNFTTKKLFTNVYGQNLRIRFLKIDKELIIGDGSLGLEERRQTVCISERKTDNYMLPEEALLMNQY